jgi:hypothetical protein
MNASKVQKIYKQLNSDFRDVLAEKVKEKYGIEITTEWAFLADRLITTKKDGTDFTKEQLAFIAAYSDGYGDAMGRVK